MPSEVLRLQADKRSQARFKKNSVTYDKNVICLTQSPKPAFALALLCRPVTDHPDGRARALLVAVTLIWFIPDRRIEKALRAWQRGLEALPLVATALHHLTRFDAP